MSKRNRLELTWIGKDERPRLEPRILIEEPSLSHHAKARVGDDDIFDNMLIHGDNLLALKALEQEYAGKVQCVYIDPPYNTGSAFEHYDDGLEHSIWLSMMKMRMDLIRSLLAPTGSVFVHLDDNEADYMKVVMDEIFGRSNFVSRITVEARSPSAFSTVNPGVFKASEYVIWFARDRARMKEFRVRTPRNPDPAYSRWIENPDDPPANWRMTTVRDAFESRGGNRRGRPSEAAINKFIVQNAQHVFRLTAISDTGAGKAVLELKKESAENPGRVFCLDRGPDLDPTYVLDGQTISFYSKNVITIDGELTASMPLTNVWTDVAWEGIANEGGVQFKKGKKPEKLIKRCLELTTDPGDLVLDSFAGSGTTGAVAHKMGRRWIMVELGEHAKTHIVPRMKKVIDGEDPGGITKAVDWKGGGGFRFYRLAPSLLEKDKWDNWIINTQYNPAMLAEAMCKMEGFRYAPNPEVFWMHGQSTESDFIYVTTQNLSRAQLQFISDQVGESRSLLICCSAFRAKRDEFANLTLKKIPQAVLTRCEWGKDDYSLNVKELPPVQVVEEAKAEKAGEKKGRRGKGEAPAQASLFEEKGE